jgi:hypothetical protein
VPSWPMQPSASVRGRDAQFWAGLLRGCDSAPKFVSYGEKIDMNLKLTWEMARDIERYTLKAWNNAMAFTPPNATP